MGRPKKEKFEPEEVEPGVIRDEEKETPMDLINNSVRVRVPGDWKKVTREELEQLEAEGKLVGYDPETEEALVK